MNARSLRGLGATAAAWAMLGAGVASAGQDTLPPGTVTLGPFRITPSLVVKDMGVDDNVFNERGDQKRDFTFTVTPRADILFRMRRLRVMFDTTTDYVYYRKYKSERGTNTMSSARIELDLGRLKPYGTVTGLNSKARVNGEVDARARHRDLAYGAGVAFKVASRTNVVVNGAQGNVVYDPEETFRGVDLERSFNGRRRAVDAGLAITLTPITTMTVLVAREQQRFQLSPDRDSNTWRVSPTFAFNPTGVLRGSASVGYRRFTPLSPALHGYSGVVSAVGIGATIYGRHEMTAQFTRDVQYSYDLENDYFLGTGGSVSWTWLLFGPVDVRATGGRLLMDYRGGLPGAADTTTTYGGGVGYRFSNRARLSANVAVTRRDSKNSADRTYRGHRFFAGLTWGTTS